MNTSYASVEKVSDDIDFASNIALAETESHVKGMQARLRSVKLDPDFDGVHCVECGARINKARIEALKFVVHKDGKTKFSEHHTDRISVGKDGTYVTKHSTDKCVDCQEEMGRIQSTMGRQYA